MKCLILILSISFLVGVKTFAQDEPIEGALVIKKSKVELGGDKPRHAKTEGKCDDRVKFGPLEWAQEVFESDLETDNQIGSSPISISLMAPILMNKSKNPPKVFEGYSIDWKMKFRDKEWSYTGYYLFDENCHRMKTAEILMGKEMEKRAAEKKVGK